MKMKKKTNEYSLEHWARCRASPAQPAIEKKAGPEKKHTSKQQASIDKQASIGYSRIMKLSNFLYKYHSRDDKIRILEKMLKAASSSKRQAISLKKARNIIFKHKDVKKIS